MEKIKTQLFSTNIIGKSLPGLSTARNNMSSKVASHTFKTTSVSGFRTSTAQMSMHNNSSSVGLNVPLNPGANSQ